MVLVRPISRRAALQAALLAAGTAALGATTACGTETATVRAGSATTATGGTATSDTDTDIAVLTSAIGAETRLLELCSTTRRRHPDLESLIRPVAVTQRAHVRRLTESLAEPPSLPSPPTTTVPSSRSGALRALTAAFSAAEQDRLSDCLRATSGLLARVFASVSASHAVTVESVRAAR